MQLLLSKMKVFLLLICFSFFYLSSYAQLLNRNWGHQGNGTYANPIIPADYSDLDAIRVGNDYYAISSTMQFSPGMVVLHSTDIINWQIISHVVDDLTQISPELNWDKMNRYGRGIWAGSIRYYKNKFWVYFGTPDEGFFMSTANKASGPWEPLHQVWKVAGWDDCCSFCDDDGQLYLVATNFATDPKNNKEYNIHLFKMTPDGKQLIMESDSVIHQSKGSEANKLYKINGFYFHLFSEVNQQGQRYIMMARSTSLYGPYELKQLNKVDRQKDREPNQGGLLQTNGGNWYFLTHHGRGDWEGRPVSLLPVTWVNNWPIIGAVGADTVGEMVWHAAMPLAVKNNIRIQTSDAFQLPKLSEQWEWNYQSRKEKWSLTARKGYLRLHAFKPVLTTSNQPIIAGAGNTITQRSMRTAANSAVIKMDIKNTSDGQVAGLTHFSTKSYSMFGIKTAEGVKQLFCEIDGTSTIGLAITQNIIWLKSEWDLQGINRYYYSLDGIKYTPFGNTSVLTWGSYRGDRIGICNYNTKADKGYVDIDWFRYQYAKN